MENKSTIWPKKAEKSEQVPQPLENQGFADFW